MCSCGCGTCSAQKHVVLNESLAPKQILSEGLKYHMDNALPLTEHVFRAGSTEYFNLWAEARALYARNILEVQGDDLEVLTETDLGNFGTIYEIEIGDKVKASKEYGGLSGEVVDVKGSFVVVKTKKGTKSYHESDLQVLNKEGIKVPLDFIMEDEYLDLNEGTFESDEIAIYDDPKGDAGETKIYKRGTGYYGQNDRFDFEAEDKAELEAKLKRWGYVLQAGSLNEEEIDEAYSTYEQRMINQIKRFKKEGLPMFNLPIKTQKFYAKHQKEIDALDETKINEEAKKKIGKPMRDSSGGKAYKVYVRDPKTKKIKTVRFGSGGLKAKINNSKARQAFAKRHKCSTRNDKTKASYWSCRLPRYAKLLGLKSSFSGFW